MPYSPHAQIRDKCIGTGVAVAATIILPKKDFFKLIKAKIEFLNSD